MVGTQYMAAVLAAVRSWNLNSAWLPFSFHQIAWLSSMQGILTS